MLHFLFGRDAPLLYQCSRCTDNSGYKEGNEKIVPSEKPRRGAATPDIRKIQGKVPCSELTLKSIKIKTPWEAVFKSLHEWQLLMKKVSRRKTFLEEVKDEARL